MSASKFIAELREVTAPNIDRHINSRGGDVDEAVAIYNALRDHPSKIVATVDGLAASAASFVAIAADKVVMNRNAEIILHLPWGGCIGNADDMREMADHLDRIGKNLPPSTRRAAAERLMSGLFDREPSRSAMLGPWPLLPIP